MAQIVQRCYPNKIEFDAVPGVTTWVVLATDGTTYASLAALATAGKKPWPWSYSGQAGIDTPTGQGPLTGQSDSSGNAGSNFYMEYNNATAPTSDNPASLCLTPGSIQYDDTDTVWNVWCRMLSTTDKLRLVLRY